MAGKRLGNIFVELGLDSTEFTKGEAKILKQAQSTSLKMEEDWRRLGSHSDRIFNAMRDNIINAQNAIVNNSKSSAAERIRAEEMASAKIKQLNEQQFGHQTTMLEGLKKNWIAATVAIGAAMVVMNKAWDLAEKAAQFEEMEAGLQGLSSQYKMTADDAIKMAKEAVSGQLSMMEAGKLASKAFALGFNPDQVKEFLTVSERLTDVMGGEIPEAFDAMERAAATGRKGGLVAIGINVDLKKALSDYAAANGIAEKSINSHMAMQIRANAIMAEAKKITDRLGEGTESTADKMNRMKATLDDVQLLLGQGIVRATSAALSGFQYLSAGVLGLTANIFNLAEGYARYRAWVYRVVGDKKQEAENTAFADKMLANGNAAWAARNDLIKQSANNWELATAKRTELARVMVRGGGSEVDTTTPSKSGKAGSEAQRQHEFLVDLYIKDEARKWEELEKYEKEYLEMLHARAEEEAKVYEKQKQGMESYRQMMAQMNIDIAEGHEKAILQIMEDDLKMYDNITKLLDSGVISFDDAMQAYEQLAEKTGKSIEDVFKDDLVNATKNFVHQIHTISNAFGQLGDAFSQMSQSYDEGSTEAMHWKEAAKQMEIAQRSLAVVNAVSAVAASATAPFPAGFVAMAAMAASMVSLLATIGEGLGGGGGAVAVPSLSKSTVLGAEDGTGSESISKSFELLENIYRIEDTKLTKIYNELKNLNDNITGLVTSIVRTGGVSLEGMGLSSSINAFKGGAESSLNSIISQDAGILTTIGNFLNRPVADIGAWIFGGGGWSGVTQSGISIGNTIVDSIMNGASVSAKQYAEVVTHKEGGWFDSDSDTFSMVYSSLDKNVTDMLTLVFKGIGSTLVLLSEELGTDTQKALNYVFEATNLNLKDMTTDEMNKALQEYISNISDTAVEALFGSMLKGYQKLNEGLMETAVRLVSDRLVVEQYLKMTNQRFEGSIPAAIKFSETLITIAGSLDKLTDAMQTYYDAFFNDAEKQAKLKSQLTETMAMYGFDLPGTRSGYRALVESLNLTTDAGQAAYVALMQMSKGADEYYKYLEQAKGNINPAQYSTNLEYQRALAGLPKYADGGYVGGGWAMVGEQGPEPVYFGSPARVISNKDSKSLLSNDEIIAELKALREEVANGNRSIATNTYKIANFTEYLEQWNSDGMPS